MAAHKDIRIQFEVEDRRFEAVGFLDEGKQPVSGDTMLERTASENDGAIGEEDTAFLSERRDKLPKELKPYYLATGKRDPGAPRFVLFFYWSGFDRGWCQGWSLLGSDWGISYLVVRRCA